jgi:hypothetical protein
VNREEYAQIQITLTHLATFVNDLDLAGFIEAGEHALSIAPIVDPTLFMHGQVKLSNVLALARACQTFQREVWRQTKRDAEPR